MGRAGKEINSQDYVGLAAHFSHGTVTPVILSCCLLQPGISCGHPGHRPYILQTGYTYSYPHSVQYGCPAGFHMTGPARIHCKSNGSWDSPPPACTPISCVFPATPANARLVALNKTFGGIVTYACRDGYVQSSGLSSAVCGAHGKWVTSKSIVCTGKMAWPWISSC